MRRVVLALTLLGCGVWGGEALAQSQPPGAPAAANTSPASPAADTSSALVNRPLLLTGLLLFGGSYAASVIDAATRSRQVDESRLYWPVAGPWMVVTAGCDASHPCGSDTAANKVLLVVDGVGQGLGMVAMAASLFVPESASRHWFFLGDSSVHAGPSRVGAGYGIGAAGVF